MMLVRVFIYWCCLVGSSLTVAEPVVTFSRQEINTMHNFGIKMALEGEREPYVIPVDISHTQLVQTETLSFANLSLLSVPPWLGRFTKLRHLDLSGTQVLAKQFAPLQNLQKLEHLDLTGVKLFGPNGEQTNTELNVLWSKLTNLRILKLGDTAGENGNKWWFGYYSGYYGSIGQLSNLVHLDLSDNQFANIASLELARLNLLRKLNLSGNRLEKLDLRQLPPSLTELNLSNNGLMAFPWSAGLDFPQLGLLKLDNNPGLQIAPEWGDVFLMQQLTALDVDSDVIVPKGWWDRLEKIRVQEEEAAYQAKKSACLAQGKTQQECESKPFGVVNTIISIVGVVSFVTLSFLFTQ